MSPLSPLAPYWLAIRWGLWAVLAAALFLSGRSCGKQAGALEVAALKQSHAEQTAQVARLAVVAAQKARAAQAAWGEAFYVIAVNHQRKLSDAEAKRSRVLADVLAGNLRLQEHWRGCLSDAAAAPGEPDAAAQRRAAGAADLVRIGAEFDAYAQACRDTLTAERR